MDFKDYLRQKGISFYVVILPDEYQVSESLRREVFEQFPGLRTSPYDFELPQKELGRFLKVNHIEYLDLLPAFEDAASRGEELYLFRDTHFNDRGNFLASKKVTEFLRNKSDLLKN